MRTLAAAVRDRGGAGAELPSCWLMDHPTYARVPLARVQSVVDLIGGVRVR